ncbi:MAG: hypothetical protein LCH70_06240 [Proteobacteria bacterium]|nr:hypothetical protein [Pseudomonadota bacterium]
MNPSGERDGSPDEVSLADVMRRARAAPTEAARIAILHEELRKLDPERAEVLMQQWRRRQQRRGSLGGTVQAGDGRRAWWWLGLLALAALAALGWWLAQPGNQ